MKLDRADHTARVEITGPTLNDAHDEIASSRQTSSLTIGMVSTLLLLAAYTILFLSADDAFKSLRAASGKLRTVNFDSGSLIILIGLSSVLAIAGAAVLFERAKSLFLSLLLTSFAVSDALLPGISEASLVIRYLFMMILITLAICVFHSEWKKGLNSIQWLGLTYLTWQLVGLLINGYGTASFLLLPVQFAIFLGILIGLGNEYIRRVDYLRFCHVLGWISIGLTAFHATALVLAPQPFLAGRFKSYYLLPTNFANGYALCLVAILWLALHEKREAQKILAWMALPVGLGLLVLSGTRNSILVVVVALSTFAIVWTRRIMTLGLIGVISAAVLIPLISDNTSHLDGLFNRFAKLESSTRQDVWELAWQYIMQRPFLGYGIGKAGDVLGQTLEVWEKAEYINTHNAYLGIWLQHGLVGLALVSGIMVSGLFKGLRLLYSKNFPAASKEILVLPVALLAGLFAGGMFEEYLTSRGSVQQLLWGLSLLLIITASQSKVLSPTRNTI